MDLNFFKDISNSIKENESIQKFIKELGEVLEKALKENNTKQKETLENYRKEEHLYMVSENINDRVFLWDITDKPNYEVEEIAFPKELLNKATEGAVFKYVNGQYEFYSDDGFERIYN